MDLQLYRIDEGNYLVDFRNLGYRAISQTPPSTTIAPVNLPAHSTSPPVSSFNSQSRTGFSEYERPNTADEIRARKPSATAVWRGKQSRHGDEVSSPYLFLEVAVKLIQELASPSAPA